MATKCGTRYKITCKTEVNLNTTIFGFFDVPTSNFMPQKSEVFRNLNRQNVLLKVCISAALYKVL